MKLIKQNSKYSILLLFIFMLSNSFSQNGFEKKIFEEVCNALLIHNKKILINNQLISFNLMISPIDLEYSVDTLKSITDIEKEILKDKSLEDLIDILSVREFPLFPFSNKIKIIDTSAFFSKNYLIKKDSYNFKISKKLKSNREQLKLNKYQVIENKFFLGFKYLDYYISIVLEGETFELSDYIVFQMRSRHYSEN